MPTNYDKFRGKLVDNNETVLSILGNSLAERYLKTGELGNGFAILSDKRVYFKGKCLARCGRTLFLPNTKEKAVDLDDITGSGFVYSKNVFTSFLFYLVTTAVAFALLALALLVPPLGFITLFFYLFLFGYFFLKKEALFKIALAIPAGVPLLFFILMKACNYSLFEISFVGGGIGFDINWYLKENEKKASAGDVIKGQAKFTYINGYDYVDQVSKEKAKAYTAEFENELRMAKDRLKETNRQAAAAAAAAAAAGQFAYQNNSQPVYQETNQMATQSNASQPVFSNENAASVLDTVRQLKELETQGIISNEEFEKKKKELLGL